MKCTLEIIKGTHSGKRYEASGDSFTIGRENSPGVKTNDIDFDHINDSCVSRSHVRISKTSQGLRLDETSGKNNTWINGQRLTGAFLRDGDVITLGKDGPAIRVNIVSDNSPVNKPEIKIQPDKNSIGRKTLFEILKIERSNTDTGLKEIMYRIYYVWIAVILVSGISIFIGWRGYKAYNNLHQTDLMIQNAIADGDRTIMAEIEKLKMRGDATDKNIASLKAGYELLKKAIPAMNSVINNARKGVVRINTVYDVVEAGTERRAVYEGKPCRFSTLGSGFCVKEDGYIITNAHIVSPWLFNNQLADKKLSGKRLSVSVTFDGDDENYTAEVKAVDSENDLALIKIDKEHCPYLKFSDVTPAGGEQVVILGFPAIAETGNIHANCMVIGGNISRIDPDGTVLYSIITHSGNSGGPVILSSGEVIAVHSSGLYSDEGACFVSQGAEDMMVMSSAYNNRYISDTAGTIDVSNKISFKNNNESVNTNNISKGINSRQVSEFIRKNI